MKAKIKFYIKSWAGIEKKFPDPVEKELSLSRGDKLGVNDLGGFPGSGFVVSDPNFEITEVTDEGIQIVTNGLVERNPNGNINLVKASHGIKHHLTFGQTIELVTQTMDSGFSVSITPLEIINE